MEIKLTEKQNVIAANLLKEKQTIEQAQALNQEKMNIFLTTICGSNGIENSNNIEYRDGMLVVPDERQEIESNEKKAEEQ